MRIIVLVCIILHTVFAGEQEGKGERSVYQEAMDFVRGCEHKELSLCLKERGLRYLETLPDNVDIGFGLKIKSNNLGENSRASRISSSVVLPNEPRAREQALEEMILEKIKEYVKSHTLEYRIPDETFEVLDGSVEEGRKKKGRRGGFRLRPMMMLLQVKAAMLGAVALKFIGLLAFKALLIAKIALMISSLVALKKIAEPKHRSSTYELVAHPHYEDHDHFDRAFSPEGQHNGYSGARKLR